MIALTWLNVELSAEVQGQVESIPVRGTPPEQVRYDPFDALLPDGQVRALEGLQVHLHPQRRQDVPPASIGLDAFAIIITITII